MTNEPPFISSNDHGNPVVAPPPPATPVDAHDALWCAYWTDRLAIATAEADVHRRNHDTEHYLEAETARAWIKRQCDRACARCV